MTARSCARAGARCRTLSAITSFLHPRDETARRSFSTAALMLIDDHIVAYLVADDPPAVDWLEEMGVVATRRAQIQTR